MERRFNYEKMSCNQLFWGCLEANDMDLVETARWLEACANSGLCGWAHEGDAFRGSTNEVAAWVDTLANVILIRALKALPHDPKHPAFNAQRFPRNRDAFWAWRHEEVARKKVFGKEWRPYMEWLASPPEGKDGANEEKEVDA